MDQAAAPASSLASSPALEEASPGPDRPAGFGEMSDSTKRRLLQTMANKQKIDENCQAFWDQKTGDQGERAAACTSNGFALYVRSLYPADQGSHWVVVGPTAPALPTFLQDVDRAQIDEMVRLLEQATAHYGGATAEAIDDVASKFNITTEQVDEVIRWIETAQGDVGMDQREIDYKRYITFCSHQGRGPGGDAGGGGGEYDVRHYEGLPVLTLKFLIDNNLTISDISDILKGQGAVDSVQEQQRAMTSAMSQQDSRKLEYILFYSREAGQQSIKEDIDSRIESGFSAYFHQVEDSGIDAATPVSAETILSDVVHKLKGTVPPIVCSYIPGPVQDPLQRADKQISLTDIAENVVNGVISNKTEISIPGIGGGWETLESLTSEHIVQITSKFPDEPTKAAAVGSLILFMKNIANAADPEVQRAAGYKTRGKKKTKKNPRKRKPRKRKPRTKKPKKRTSKSKRHSKK